MSGNPYQTPQDNPMITGVRDGTLESLKGVASAQRGLIYSILAMLISYIGLICFAVMMDNVARSPEDKAAYLSFMLIPGMLHLISSVTAFVYTLILSIRTTGIVAGLIFGTALCIPCVNMFVLLVINQMAVSVLNRNGIHVGFLGADMSQFDRFEQPGHTGSPFG